MSEEYIKIPLKIIKGRSTFNERKNIRFIVKSKYNYLTKDNKILSKVWFSKAESYFTYGYSIVKKNDFKTNILDENGNFMLDDWYYEIERIYKLKNLFLVKKKIESTGEIKCRIFSIEKGFLYDEEWHDDFKIICGEYFIFLDYLNNKINKRIYSFISGLISNEYFKDIKYICNSFLVSKTINNIVLYNILKINGDFILNDWSLIEPVIKNNYYIYNTIKDEKLFYVNNENGKTISTFYLSKKIKPDDIEIINFIENYKYGMF